MEHLLQSSKICFGRSSSSPVSSVEVSGLSAGNAFKHVGSALNGPFWEKQLLGLRG